MVDWFDRFTERARRVLTLAQEEAQRFNHNYIGTEHLLLGLVREGDGVAARVLNNLGVQLPKVRSAVEFIIGRGESMIMGEIGLTERAKKVIELAVDEARRLNHPYIGTEHLLLGLVREGEGIAAGVLESQGVRLETVRAQVMQVISSPGGGLGRRHRASDQFPPDAPSTLREAMRDLEVLRDELEAAIVAQDFDLARRLHQRDRELKERIRRLEQDWQGVVTPMASGPPRPRDLPALRELIRVVPIAQTQRHGDVEAIALALEVYADGFVVTVLLQATGQPGLTQGSPDLPLAATDDRGGRYTSRMHGGSGGGDPQRWQWRLARSFTPALDPAARELRLEAAEFHWLRPDPTQRTLTPASVVPGPWTFTVALPGATGG
jgi:hypothetical protein